MYSRLKVVILVLLERKLFAFLLGMTYKMMLSGGSRCLILQSWDFLEWFGGCYQQSECLQAEWSWTMLIDWLRCFQTRSCLSFMHEKGFNCLPSATFELKLIHLWLNPNTFDFFTFLFIGNTNINSNNAPTLPFKSTWLYYDLC